MDRRAADPDDVLGGKAWLRVGRSPLSAVAGLVLIHTRILAALDIRARARNPDSRVLGALTRPSHVDQDQETRQFPASASPITSSSRRTCRMTNVADRPNTHPTR